MARRSKKNAQQRLQEAVIKGAVLGLAFVLLPHLLGTSPIAAGIRPLSNIGWLLLLGCGVTALVLRKKTPSMTPRNEAQAAVQSRPVARPDRPPPPVERIEPVMIDPFPQRHATSVAPSRPTTWGPPVFAVIEWRRFEALVEALFAQAGFETRSQSHGADGGVDIWLFSKSQPDGEPVSIVQCKHWQGKRVGVDKIRELRGVMASRNVKRGQFATTSTFTPDAVTFGRANSINLLDVDGLLSLIATRTQEQQQRLLDVAFDGEYWRPTCVNCGIKLTERAPRQGGLPFWGCVNYPTCRTTMPMRSVAQAAGR